MKMTLVSVTSSWLCATGVAVISSYCILSHGTAGDHKKAEQVACSVSKRGTVSEYKSTNRHSSAIKKTTSRRKWCTNLKNLNSSVDFALVSF